MTVASFDHFIVTPFNVDIGVWPRERLMDFEYLAGRLGRFLEICAPSVREQSVRDFCWLVFVDAETPDPVLRAMLGLEERGEAVVVRTGSNACFHSVLRGTIERLRTPGRWYLITTSLDCDDAVGNDFVRLIQSGFRAQEFEFILLPLGFELSHGALDLVECWNNTFHSLVETYDCFVTCRATGHWRLPDLTGAGVPLRGIISEPMWLRHVDRTNWMTQPGAGLRPCGVGSLRRHFGHLRDLASLYLGEVGAAARWQRHLFDRCFGNRLALPLATRAKHLLCLPHASIARAMAAVRSLQLRARLRRRALSAPEASAAVLATTCKWRRSPRRVQ